MQVQTKIEKMDTELRAMFEQLMAKDGKHPKTTLGDSSHGKGSDISFPSKVVSPSLSVEAVDITSGGSSRFYKHGRLECPHFDGGNFFWLAYEA